MIQYNVLPVFHDISQNTSAWKYHMLSTWRIFYFYFEFPQSIRTAYE